MTDDLFMYGVAWRQEGMTVWRNIHLIYLSIMAIPLIL